MIRAALGSGAAALDDGAIKGLGSAIDGLAELKDASLLSALPHARQISEANARLQYLKGIGRMQFARLL
jgi:hypothetical protein